MHAWTTAEADPANADDWYGIADPDDQSLYPSGCAFTNVVARYEGRGATPAPRRTIRVCGGPPPPDQDGDGTPDSEDDYPLDPLHSSGSGEVIDEGRTTATPIRPPRVPADYFAVSNLYMPANEPIRAAHYDEMNSLERRGSGDPRLAHHRTRRQRGTGGGALRLGRPGPPPGCLRAPRHLTLLQRDRGAVLAGGRPGIDRPAVRRIHLRARGALQPQRHLRPGKPEPRPGARRHATTRSGQRPTRAPATGSGAGSAPSSTRRRTRPHARRSRQRTHSPGRSRYRRGRRRVLGRGFHPGDGHGRSLAVRIHRRRLRVADPGAKRGRGRDGGGSGARCARRNRQWRGQALRGLRRSHQRLWRDARSGQGGLRQCRRRRPAAAGLHGGSRHPLWLDERSDQPGELLGLVRHRQSEDRHADDHGGRLPGRRCLRPVAFDDPPADPAALHPCDKAAPDRDGDGVDDAADPAPLDATLPADAPDGSLRLALRAAPKRATRHPVARFRYLASGAASYQCKVDSRPFRACGPTTVLRGLRDGRHRIAIRAVAPSGATGDPVSYRWLVDTRGPRIRFRGHASSRGAGRVRIAFKVSDRTAVKKLRCKVDHRKLASLPLAVADPPIESGAPSRSGPGSRQGRQRDHREADAAGQEARVGGRAACA